MRRSLQCVQQILEVRVVESRLDEREGDDDEELVVCISRGEGSKAFAVGKLEHSKNSEAGVEV